jgi:replicative DNA helicase
MNPRSLPHSEDLEKGLLSSIRYQPRILDEIGDILKTDVFYIPAHALILEAFMAIALRSSLAASGIDFYAVKNHLKASGKLEEAGGPEYLAAIWEFVPTGEGWRFYAEGVLECYQRRVAILECQRLIERMYDQTPVTETIRETVERTLARLAIQGSRSETTLKERAHEFIEILEKRALHLDTTGITFGLSHLDEIIGGLHGGEVCVIAADTSVGKSALALQAVEITSLERGLTSALFSLEVQWVQVMERLHARFGIDMKSLKRGILTKPEHATLMKTTELLIRQNNVFIEDNFGQDISGICSRSRALKARHDLKLIVVDYLQLVGAPGTNRGDNREREVAAVSRRLKALANELDLVVLSLSQVNEHGFVRESRAIGHDADLVLIIERPELDSESCEILVRKQRNGPAGITIPANFYGQQMRFESA